jgi:hypothetical protein
MPFELQNPITFINMSCATPGIPSPPASNARPGIPSPPASTARSLIDPIPSATIRQRYRKRGKPFSMTLDCGVSCASATGGREASCGNGAAENACAWMSCACGRMSGFASPGWRLGCSRNSSMALCTGCANMGGASAGTGRWGGAGRIEGVGKSCASFQYPWSLLASASSLKWCIRARKACCCCSNNCTPGRKCITT